MNLKHKAEALLFSSGRRMEIQELAKLCRRPTDDILEALRQLKYDYEEKESSLMLIEEGTFWKLAVQENHLDLVKQIVTETELSKTLMETLAVIAFKYPIKQSELIKLRTNKAYDHLTELEEMGYISRQKYSRTKLIKLAPKFFEYFDLAPEKLKEQFQSFDGLANAIKQKEDEIKKAKEEQIKLAQEEKKKEKEIDLMDTEGNFEKLEVYEQEKKDENAMKDSQEKLGELSVVDEEEQGEGSVEETEEDEPKAEEGETEEPSDETADTPEETDAVDDAVERMLHPKEESDSSEEVAQEASEEPEGEESQEQEEQTAEPKQKKPKESSDEQSEDTEEKEEQPTEEKKEE